VNRGNLCDQTTLKMCWYNKLYCYVCSCVDV